MNPVESNRSQKTIPDSPAHPEDSPYQGEAKGGNFILRISLRRRSRKGADGFRQDGHGGKSENSSFSTLRHRGRLDGGWGLKMEEEPPIFTQRRGGVLASERILKVRNRGWRRSAGGPLNKNCWQKHLPIKAFYCPIPHSLLPAWKGRLNRTRRVAMVILLAAVTHKRKNRNETK